MPVSVVCESSANVTAALRESLGVSGSCSSAANADDVKAGTSAMTSNGNSSDSVAGESLQSKLVASTKRVLLSKIEYEEVTNYNQSVLENLKTKYIVLKPNLNTNGNSSNLENGRASPANCNGSNGNSNSSNIGANGIRGSAADVNGSNNHNNNNNNTTANNNNTNGGNASSKRSNPNELPQAKRVLYPRENVRIGWKNSTRKWQVGVGMMNVGNTCYLNSTLQALFHVPSMANWLLSDTQHMERCDAADAGCIICAMAKTLQASQSSQSAIRPHFVYSKLKSICKHLVMGRQEDAHEFLRYLVEAMEKSYLTRCRNYKELDQYSKETTPLNQILGGYLKTAVQCLACNHVSVTFQHFQDLLLDIRKADTIEEALEGYFARERLEDMGYKCESCKKKVSATKQFLLERAPIALCIQLKRFSMLGTKLNKQITIKPRLDLTKFASRRSTSGEQLTYKLVAMVTHLGASQHCGHYTAIGLTETGTYYNYDDSYVRSVSMPNVCNTNAYIIFYEMDNTPPRQVTSTQVSGASVKENYQKLNGYTTHAQRLIGPQLPPAGLSSYTTNNLNASKTSITTTTSTSNGSSASTPTPLFSNGSKLSVNRQSAIPTSSNNNSNSNSNGNNSKIMIHYKNNSNGGLKSSVSSSTTNAANVASSSSASSNSQRNNNGNTSANSYLQQNGLLTGTGKFQESANSKSALASTSNKGQVAATSNGNESSCSSDHEDEVSSSTMHSMRKQFSSNNVSTTSSKTSLPSMPKLFDNNSNNTTTTNGKRSNISSLLNTSTTVKSTLKSLVPYGSETDDDDASTESKRLKCNTTTTDLKQHLYNNPLKRRNSLSSSCGSDSADDDDNNYNFIVGPKTNGIKLKKAATTSGFTAASSTSYASNHNGTNGNSALFYAATSSSMYSPSSNSSAAATTSQSKAKQKTDAIDEIFNFNKRNANSNNTNHNNSNNHNHTTTPLKKQKSQFMVTSTTPATDSDNEDSDNNDNDNDDDITRTPFKRSHSTPPSPPVIKSKTGVWQVTTLKPDTASMSSLSEPKTPKNPKNPFATKTPDLYTKRTKTVAEKNSEKRASTFAGNGYQRDTSSDSAVSELLKQSHRGYGAPVLTWNGEQTEIEKEINEETREQRQRDWEEEEDSEMDRGRQRKIKAHKETHLNNRTAAYNPFQEQQESQRRWKHGSGGGGGGFHRGNFRHQFQRNKFKFQRFNHKYQRMYQRNGNGNSNGHAGGSNSNSNGYNRRDS